MVARLQEVNRILLDQIDDSVLVSQPSRPHVRAQSLERFGLSNTDERIAEDRLNKIEQPQCELAVRSHKVDEIVEKLWLKHRDAVAAGFKI